MDFAVAMKAEIIRASSRIIRHLGDKQTGRNYIVAITNTCHVPDKIN